MVILFVWSLACSLKSSFFPLCLSFKLFNPQDQERVKLVGHTKFLAHDLIKLPKKLSQQQLLGIETKEIVAFNIVVFYQGQPVKSNCRLVPIFLHKILLDFTYCT